MSWLEWLALSALIVPIHYVLTLHACGATLGYMHRRLKEQAEIFGDNEGLRDELADIRGRLIEIESKLSTRN